MDETIDVLGSVSFGWLRERGAPAFDESFFLDPRRRLDGEARANRIVAAAFPRDPIYNFEASLVQTAGRRRPVALIGGLQPNLILGAALGAQFVFYGDKDPDIKDCGLRIADCGNTGSADALVRSADCGNTGSADALVRSFNCGVRNAECGINIPREIDWKNRWPIALFLEQVAWAREELGERYAVIPPFFWDTTGRATFHGILTTAQKLVGERIFVDLALRPDFARELFDWIVDAYAELSETFARAAGLTITGVHIGECSACMVGPAQYQEFILPPLARLARRLGPLRLHSCGHSDHLLDLFATLEGLQCLNVGSGTSVKAIREHFGSLRIDLIPPVELLTHEGPEAVDRWVRRTVEENEGGRLQIQFHLDRGQPAENCLQIIRTLRGLGYECAREEVT